MRNLSTRFRAYHVAVSAVLFGVLLAAWTPALATSGGAKPANAAESPQAVTTASMETVHASYLDLTGNIADLRSRVGAWLKGDEASLNVAKEKAERIGLTLGYVGGAWPQPMAGAAAKTKSALGPIQKALEARDLAAAEQAAKALGDASHDLTHAFYGDYLPSLGSARFAPMASHAVYLDLSANIADLRSRVDLWQKGDEGSLNVANEKSARIAALTQHVASTGVLVGPASAIAKALPAVNAALDAKDAAAAQTELKPLANASHDLTHDFYDWVNRPGIADDVACVQASYLDLTSNLADLRSRVGEWGKGDEGSLNVAKEKLDRAGVILAHTPWPKAMAGAIDKSKAALGPVKQALDAKDAAASQETLKLVADASHDVTHAYYGDWMPSAPLMASKDASGTGDLGGHNVSGHDTGAMPGMTTQPESPPPADTGAHLHAIEASMASGAPTGPNWLVLGAFATPVLLGTAVAVRRRRTGSASDEFADAPEPRHTNLLDNAFFRKVMESRLYPGLLQVATITVFTVVVYQLFFGPAAAHSNFGTAMTWILWWPLIPLFFLLLGRFWCAICPFATLSDLVQKVVGQNRPVPQFLRKYGIWIIDALFVLITWSDHTFGIVESPRGSGVLLVGLILGVVTAGLLFERRTWCRYLCFLGGLSGNYSRAGMLELRATPSICQKCKVQACYRGNAKAPGCPMFEFPRTMETSARCNLCAYCVKSCPNGSIRITPRMPTRELLNIRRPKFEEAFLACVIMGVVFVQNVTMLEVWKGILTWLEQVVGTRSYFVTFTITFTILMALPVVALFAASYLSRAKGNHTTLAAFTLFGYALIPLDLAGHLAHNLFHLLAEGKAVVFTGLELFGIASQGSPALLDNLTIQLLQYGLVLLGTLGSLYTAYRIARSRSASREVLWSTLAPIGALMLVLGVANIALFYLPMAMRM